MWTRPYENLINDEIAYLGVYEATFHIYIYNKVEYKLINSYGPYEPLSVKWFKSS